MLTLHCICFRHLFALPPFLKEMLDVKSLPLIFFFLFSIDQYPATGVYHLHSMFLMPETYICIHKYISFVLTKNILFIVYVGIHKHVIFLLK